MNKKFQIALAVVVLAGIVGVAWYTYDAQQKSEALSNKLQQVSDSTPVRAIQGKKVTMSLINQQSGQVAVTIPGVQNTPTLIAAGASATVVAYPTTPGTYPIMEQAMVQNTRSIEGGTEPADFEVGHIVVAPH